MEIAFLLEDKLRIVDAGRISLAQDGHNTQDFEQLFYDWLDDGEGCLRGLEIHIDIEHPLAQALRRRSYVTFNPYPQVWFSSETRGSSRGLEAFGDIKIFTTNASEWCVIVSSDWLSKTDEEQLKRLMGDT